MSDQRTSGRAPAAPMASAPTAPPWHMREIQVDVLTSSPVPASQCTELTNHSAIAMFDVFVTRVLTSLRHVLEDFPPYEDIHPLHADLLFLQDALKSRQALAAVKTAYQDTLAVEETHRDTLAAATDVHGAYETAVTSVTHALRPLAGLLDALEDLRAAAAAIPPVQHNCRSVVLCGPPRGGAEAFMDTCVGGITWSSPDGSFRIGTKDSHYLRWQILQCPPLRDTPLEEKDASEMQTVVTLAHLPAAMLFCCDISEQCGLDIAQQAKLWHGLGPLLDSHPAHVVVTGTAHVPPDVLAERMASLHHLVSVPVLDVSTEEGVIEALRTACQSFLAQRRAAKQKRFDKPGEMPVPEELQLQRQPEVTRARELEVEHAQAQFSLWTPH